MDTGCVNPVYTINNAMQDADAGAGRLKQLKKGALAMTNGGDWGDGGGKQRRGRKGE